MEKIIFHAGARSGLFLKATLYLPKLPEQVEIISPEYQPFYSEIRYFQEYMLRGFLTTSTYTQTQTTPQYMMGVFEQTPRGFELCMWVF